MVPFLKEEKHVITFRYSNVKFKEEEFKNG